MADFTGWIAGWEGWVGCVGMIGEVGIVGVVVAVLDLVPEVVVLVLFVVVLVTVVFFTIVVEFMIVLLLTTTFTVGFTAFLLLFMNWLIDIVDEAEGISKLVLMSKAGAEAPLPNILLKNPFKNPAIPPVEGTFILKLAGFKIGDG